MKTEQFFRCLADKVRVQAILLLWQEGELSTAAIAQLLDVSENMIRRHMSLLSKHQIVLCKHKELFQYCRINPDLPIWMSKIIKHTCRGNKKLLEDILSTRSKTNAGLPADHIEKYSV